MKKIFKNQAMEGIFCYGISFFFTKGLSFLILPIYVNFISKEDYGYLTFLITLLSLLSILTDMGLNNGLYRFIRQDFKDRLLLGTTIHISVTVNIAVVISVLSLSSYWHVFPYDVEFNHLILLSISLALGSFNTLNLTYLRIKNKAVLFTTISLMQPFSHAIGIGVLLFFNALNVETLLISTCLSNTLTASIAAYKNRKCFNLRFKIKTARKLIKYTTGTMISLLALYALTGMDKLYLSYFIKQTALADYNLTMVIASMSLLLMEPISLWYFANRFKMLKENKSKFELITSNLVVLNLWISTFIFINGRFLYENISSSDYKFSLFLFVMAVYSFHMKYISSILNIGCYTGKDTYIVSKIATFTATIVIILYYFLDHSDNRAYDVLFSLSIGYTILFLLFFYFSARETALKYKKNEIFLNYLFSLFLCILAVYSGIGLILTNLLFFVLASLINIKKIKGTYDDFKNKKENKSIEKDSIHPT